MKTKGQIKDVFPLTPMQEGMLFHSLYEKDALAYFVQTSYRLKGTLDPQMVEKSINELFKRHDVLRSAFIHEGVDRPLQVVLKERQVDFHFKDLRTLIPGSSEERGVCINEFKERDKRRLFDLTRDVLMRAAVFQVNDSEYEFIWSSHHILMDGWCLGIIISEFFEIYQSYIEERQYQLPPAASYRTYITWLEKQDMTASKNSWMKYLEGYEEIASIPKTTARETRKKQYKKERVYFTLEKEKTDRLNNLAGKNQVTLNTIFQALWGILLGEYNGREDVVFGTVVSGRPSELPGVDSIIGLFLNTIPIRIRYKQEMKFNNLLQGVQKAAIENEKHHHFPLVEIQANSSLKQNLLDHILVFENYPLKNRKIKDRGRGQRGVQGTGLELLKVETSDHTNYDFTLGIYPGEQLTFKLNYNSNVYKRERIERVSTHIVHAIDQILNDEEIFIRDLVLLPGEEKEQSLFEFNNNEVDFPQDKTVCQWIEKHAEITPDKIAVTDVVPGEEGGGGQDILSITYQHLNRKSNQLAKALKEVGIQEDDLVGILLERSHIMVESILAVWKSGGAYIPIDTADPVNRIVEIMKDSGARVLLGKPGFVDGELEKCCPGIIMGLDEEQLKSDPCDSFPNPGYEINMNSLAYVIYTSGSTGKPKGAMVEHIGMMNHIHAKINDLQLTERSIVVQNASHTFDISVWQFFAVLIIGGQTVIYPDELIMEPDIFISRLVNDGILILEVVPSYLSILLEVLEDRHDVPLLLNYLLVTGEEVKPHLVKKWFERYPDIKVVNAYGPTEASDDITHYIMEKAPDLEQIPIGKPIQNLDIYIVNNNMQLVPIGVKGEICVSGIGVGKGYLNKPELTADKFIENPYVLANPHLQLPMTTLYKTGDIGRWLADGTIEFFGRKDCQVKIRGFRIELGEIENILIRHPQIKEAVVIDKDDEYGNKYLCAYMIFHKKPDSSVIKEYLSKHLPDYMIPAHFVQLEQMPLTSNGKIDRKALPDREFGGQYKMKYISEEMLRGTKITKKDKPLCKLSGEEQEKLLNFAAATSEKERVSIREYSIQTGKKYYPLTYPQKMMYYIEKKNIGTACNNVIYSVRYPGEIDRKMLEEAINTVLYKNEALRLRIVEVEYESSIQLAQYVSDYKIQCIDCFDFSKKDRKMSLEEWIDKDAKKAIHFIDSDLFYFAYVKFNEKESGYYVKLHHIISDALSFHLLFKEINKIYENLKQGETVNVRSNPSYLQYISDEEEYLKSTQLRDDLKFWLNNILPPPGEINLSHKKGDTDNIEANICKLAFTGALHHKMHEYCRINKISIFRLILSALSIYISRASASDDISIGTLNNNRTIFSYIKMFGIFISFIPIRIRIDGNINFYDFVKKIGGDIDCITKNHQKFPFEILATQLREKISIDHRYFYNINLVSHPDLEEGHFEIERHFSGFDATPLSIYINRSNRDIEGVLELDWVFQVEQFSKSDIMQMHHILENILNDILAKPGKKLSEIELLSQEEKNHLLCEFNNSEITFPEIKISLESLKNLTVYILSQKGMLQPVGLVGELCIGGDEVSRVYLKHSDGPEKENFIRNPFSKDGMIYRTGELARRISRGSIEFLGRIDRQVWMKGNRIDTGAIESAFVKHGDVKEVVVVRKYNIGNYSLGSCLWAFLVSEKSLIESEMKEYLSSQLPQYMIPQKLVQLERIPLTPEGIADRKLLEEIEIIITPRHKGPANEREEKLVQIWQEVLGIEGNKISVDDNFLELGGHSLKAITMASKIHKAFNVKILLQEIFKTPTIRGLSEFIKNSEKYQFNFIEQTEKREYYELSSAQKRLYILHQMQENNAGYNMPQAVILEGEIEKKKQKIGNVFRKLIERHESLRTSFEMQAEEPVQKIHEADEVTFEIEYYEEESLVSDHSSLVTNEITRDFVQPFDLSQAPLLRVGLVKLEKEKHIFMMDMHHIITDGTSQAIFIKEFMALYGGEEPEPLRIQYKDYVRWQKSGKEKEQVKRQEAYWVNEFKGEIPILNVPLDYSRPSLQSFEGRTIRFFIGKEEKIALETLASDDDATLYMVLLGIFYVVLSKLCGQEDIVVGTPIEGRRHVELEHIIGIFINTLALRNYPSEGKRFKDFLKELKERVLEAFENQEYQFEDLVDILSVRRDAGRNPLFDVLFVLQNMENPGVEIPGLKLMPFENQYNISKFDLSLIGIEAGETLLFIFEYCTQLFKEETIERFIGHFKRAVSFLVENPEVTLSEIEIIDEDEKNRILFEFNQTAAAYPGDKTIHELFEEQVEKFRDNIAVVGMEHEPWGMASLTYMELNEKSNRLAYLLREKGVKADTVVAVVLGRTLWMIGALLGILKAGGAYLPIDPDYPDERKNYMLSDSSASILLTTRNLSQKIDFEKEMIYLESNKAPEGPPLKPAAREPQSVTIPENLAYTLYTSGTTGRPKGCTISHKNVLQLLINNRQPVVFNDDDVWVMAHSYCFDLSVWEMYGSLLYGGRLVIPLRQTVRDTADFLTFIKQHKVTVLTQTPAAFYNLIAEEQKYENKTLDRHLRVVIFGGDKLELAYLKSWIEMYPLTRVRLINMYGITETTIHSTHYTLRDEDIAAPTALSPIGVPLPETTVYIFNPQMQLQPVAVTGELYVGGSGVSRGYLNKPKLVHDRFLENPYKAGEILYRSGDLGRWLPDGSLQYIGRIDHQVKLRGFRIELGEIESQLLKHEHVKEAVVIDRGSGADKYLCAYIVPHTSPPPTAMELRNYLSTTQPDYMIPSFYVALEKIPLTPNGKLDRKALPEPEVGKTTADFTAPRDEMEEKLAGIWAEVLNIKTAPGIDDNFFELGGHSLKAVIMLSKIHKELNAKVLLAELFKIPTIKGLSQYIKRADEERYASIEVMEKKEYYVLSSAQKRLYVFQQMVPDGIGYNMPRIISLKGDIEKEKIEDTFKELINRHESLRTSFHVINSQPMQKVHEPHDVEFKIEYYDIRKAEAEVEVTRPVTSKYPSQEVSFEPAAHSANRQTVTSVMENFVRPFDLSQAPLVKGALVKTTREKHILLLDLHHIITDGISQEILTEEFMFKYRGRGEELPPLRLQYKDFAEWQTIEKEKETMRRQEDFWLKEFEDGIPLLDLPFDYPSRRFQTFESDYILLEIDKELTEKTRRFVLNTGTTLYNVLLAAYNVLLSKYTGQEDIVVGTVVAGRRHADLENIVGMFVNMLPMRNDVDENKTFREFLEEVKENTLNAFENQDYPLEELVKKLGIQGVYNQNPLFDTVFALQNFEKDEMERTPGIETPYEVKRKMTPFDLSFVAHEAKETITLTILYKTALFKFSTLEKILEHYIEILRKMVEGEEIKLKDITLSYDSLEAQVKATDDEYSNFGF